MSRLAAFCAVVILSSAVFAADTLPKRKEGLWRLTMRTALRPDAPSITSEQCVDAKSDAALQERAMHGGDSSAKCTTKGPRPTKGGFEFEADCTSAEGTTHSAAKITGDMQSKYTVDNTMTFTPARHGLTTAKMTVMASHEGACPADMQPGEVRMAGLPGMPMNPSKPAGGFDGEKLKNMTPEERMKWVEEMKKNAEAMKKAQGAP